jgi:phosphotransacetylase
MPSRPHFQRLASDARLLPPLPAAVVHPCDAESLQCALSGAFAGYLAPVLVGPTVRIRAAADAAGLDVSHLPIVDAADDPRASCLAAIELAASGEVRCLIQGALRIDDLLAPIAAPDRGLRGERRFSHVHVLDLPGRARPLLVADALLNLNPNLAAKADILHNTFAFAIALGIREPRAAVLAAVDVVSPAFPSTADADALRSMAEEGLFGTARVAGPLTADGALSPEAARAGGALPLSAGEFDVLLAPNRESAALLVRALTAITGGLAAGVVLGARVPIIAPARADGTEARMASCVLASLVAAARPAPAPGVVAAPGAQPAPAAAGVPG